MERNNLEFECNNLTNGSRFPLDYTGRGKDISPEIRIFNLSPNAKSLIIILEDLDHPVKGFTHWVIWNIPAINTIPEGIPHGRKIPSLGGAKQGVAYGLHKYAGPKPPTNVTHIYKFSIYSLDCFLGLSSFSTKKRVLKSASNHILQRGELEGFFD